ncbi:hypothetical protein GUJ93_ZPchr0002g26158 [Zizania palustris]|uniref:Secreted protein n=1 Tax=Zizania palustris TaxID=103762 RepID=A0A8J5VCB0_ZIZPA|nr:hypothetical protein GUJ93_ZPchr0002g26158 [Zizania palustris]
MTCVLHEVTLVVVVPILLAPALGVSSKLSDATLVTNPSADGLALDADTRSDSEDEEAGEVASHGVRSGSRKESGGGARVGATTTMVATSPTRRAPAAEAAQIRQAGRVLRSLDSRSRHPWC